MKIAFTGKGGSGKSTLATVYVEELRRRGTRVLAIDADHNMDLSYNLGANPSVYLGNDPDRIKEFAGSARTDSYAGALNTAKKRGLVFTLNPADAYTSSVSVELKDGLRLITAGPHTDRVRSQEACSHSLSAPLKIYLPLLRLSPDEAVVIDERAGTDPVATGILSGIDLAVIVREPTPSSARVTEQIRRELGLAGIAHIIFDNKQSGLAIDSARVSKAILEHRHIVVSD